MNVSPVSRGNGMIRMSTALTQPGVSRVESSSPDPFPSEKSDIQNSARLLSTLRTRYESTQRCMQVFTVSHLETPASHMKELMWDGPLKGWWGK